MKYEPLLQISSRFPAPSRAPPNSALRYKPAVRVPWKPAAPPAAPDYLLPVEDHHRACVLMRSRFSHFHDFHCLSGPLAAHMAADADEQRDVSRAMGVVQQILATDTPEQKAAPSKPAEGPKLPAQAPATAAPMTGVPALYTTSEGTD